MPALRRHEIAVDEIPDHDMHGSPGHLLRRAQQRAVELFHAEVKIPDLTPPQFALLLTLRQNPGASQAALVERTGLDRSTLGEMATRLARRGLIARARKGEDRRSNTLSLTAEGAALVRIALPMVLRAQDRILAPVPVRHRRVFMACLRRLSGLPDDPRVAMDDD